MEISLQRERSIDDDRYTNVTFHDFEDVNRNPIFGYKDEPLLSLEKTLESMSDTTDTMGSIRVAMQKSRDSDVLTRDESAAIYLYSMSSSVFRCLNKALRAEDRHALKQWFPFLKLFITALEKLPSTKELIWRGINGHDDSQSFVDNDLRTWWSVNSCSKALNIVDIFLGGEGTLFAISAVNGKDISAFSAYPDEQEVVLIPGSRVHRKPGSLNISNRVFLLHLEEISSQG